MMEPLDEIAKALAAAQIDMSNPAFDAQNPHFKNRFASLAAVRNAVVPVMAKHGVFVSQDLQTAEGSVSCTTILTHSSGQQMRFGPYTLPVSKADAQGYGSASTYCRRYHLMAVAGVVGDADDDAESAVGRGTGPSITNGAKAVSTSAKLLASTFLAALKKGVDLEVLRAHNEANEDQELYQEAWSVMAADKRAAFKDALTRARAHISEEAIEMDVKRQ